jgi:hypothetical protein
MKRSIVAITVVLAAAACSGGAGTVGSASSSSGGSSSGGSSSGSSGPVNCNAICSTGATLTFDEPNDNARLHGVIVETCFKNQCAQGRLEARDAGPAYQLTLTPTFDAGSMPQIEAQVQASPSAPGSLRFRIEWMLGFGTTAGVADGDTYTVSARTSPTGPEIFDRSFTATYTDSMICGSTCKTYKSPTP